MVLGSSDSPEQPPDLSLESLAPVGEDAGRQDRVEGNHHVHEASDPAIKF